MAIEEDNYSPTVKSELDKLKEIKKITETALNKVEPLLAWEDSRFCTLLQALRNIKEECADLEDKTVSTENRLPEEKHPDPKRF